MPRIPTYDTPQVQVQGIQPARANTNLAAGSTLEGMGKGLNAVSDYLFKVKNEAVQVRAEEAVNRLRERQNALVYGDGKDEPGALNVKSGNVFNRDKPFSESYLGKYDADAQTIEAGLANDNQKAMFQRAASRFKVEFGGQLARHEAVEGNAYRESVYKGVVESETEHVTQNFNDPDSVAQSIERVKANTLIYARNQGMGADQLAMTVKEAESAMHMLVVQRKLDGDPNKGIPQDPLGAKQYYQDLVS